jgi:hypothetical protein
MRKILIPSKDTTIYQAYPNNNAGLDEILEIGKTIDPVLVEQTYTASSARSLLYFTLPTTESVSANANYFLNLRLANATDVIRNQKILVYQVSRSWDEGSGYFYQNVVNSQDGATWSTYDAYTSWSLSGGDFLTGSTSASITLTDYPLQDLRIDVTNILRPIVSQSLQNTFYGLALQFPRADETASFNQGNIKVFSTQTHTIHQPTLEIAWDDQIFVTGSLSKIPSINVKVVPNTLQETYDHGDMARISLVVRDQYPLRSFDSTLRYKNKYYLPTSSYYSIVDTQANVTIIPFDEYSKINCDTNGAYIDLDTSPLYKGRFYTLKIKIQSGSYTRTINTDNSFKVL